jgi:drug/metabolite transporter (DMT)-like permease
VAVPLAGAASLCWALGGVLSAYALRRGVSRYQSVFVSSLTAILCLNSYLLFNGTFTLYLTTSHAAVLGLLVAGVCNAVALISLTSAIELTTVASATTLYSLQIAISPLIAWLFLGESLNAMMAGGIVLITAGVVAVQRARV